MEAGKRYNRALDRTAEMDVRKLKVLTVLVRRMGFGRNGSKVDGKSVKCSMAMV
jgi:hypothetical protein